MKRMLDFKIKSKKKVNLKPWKKYGFLSKKENELKKDMHFVNSQSYKNSLGLFSESN